MFYVFVFTAKRMVKLISKGLSPLALGVCSMTDRNPFLRNGLHFMGFFAVANREF